MGKLAKFIFFYTDEDEGVKPVPVEWETATGVSPLSLANALAHAIKSLTQYGKCVQDGADILCNNGALKYGADTSNYEPYTEGIYTDGTPEVLTMTGKNLANDAEFSIEEPSWSTAAHWLGLSKNADGTFTITRPIGWGGNGFVYVGTYKAGTYKLSFDLISTADVDCGGTCAIKKKGTWTSGAVAASITGLKVAGRYSLNDFTITEDCDVWLAVGPYVDNGAQVISGNYQVELGSTATAYEPYTAQTVTGIPNLFSTLDGSVRDEVDVVSGIVTRRTEAVYENGEIVVKALAEPVTEQTTPHALHSYAGTTIVDAQTNVDPVTLSVEYAKAAS